MDFPPPGRSALISSTHPHPDALRGARRESAALPLPPGRLLPSEGGHVGFTSGSQRGRTVVLQNSRCVSSDAATQRKVGRHKAVKLENIPVTRGGLVYLRRFFRCLYFAFYFYFQEYQNLKMILMKTSVQFSRGYSIKTYFILQDYQPMYSFIYGRKIFSLFT